MILIALIAIGLGVFKWWDESDGGTPIRHAWNDPITIRTTRNEDLETVLKRTGFAMRRPRLNYGPIIMVDPGGLLEAGQSLNAPIGTAYDIKDMPAREFLEQVLKPLGLACKLQERRVIVTSIKTPNEPIEHGHHGEFFCAHNAGLWVRIHNHPNFL